MMSKITQKGVNRLDIEMSGKLNSDEMKIVFHDEPIGGNYAQN